LDKITLLIFVTNESIKRFNFEIWQIAK
jgi:hypothetical protein